MKRSSFCLVLFLVLLFPVKTLAYDYVVPKNKTGVTQGRQSIYQLYNLYESLFPTPDDEDENEKYNEDNVCDNSSYMWPIGSKKVTDKKATGTPVSVKITSKFGSTEPGIHDNGHGGLDIGADLKTNVIAAQSGEVVTVNKGCTTYGSQSCGGGFGNYIIIKHNDGNYTLYAHLHQGTLKVKNGQTVSQGQLIAGVGSSGNSTGPHLHFEVREGANSATSRVDPLKYVNPSKPRPDTGDSCDLSNTFHDFMYGLECGEVYNPKASGYFQPSGIADGTSFTIGPGLTNNVGWAFKQEGIDPNSINSSTKISKKKISKVYMRVIKSFKKAVEKDLKSNGITLNNAQILSLTSLRFNHGNINEFITSYKKNGNSPKIFGATCSIMASSSEFNGGLIRRRKLEWIMYSTGLIINNYSNNKVNNSPGDTQDTDNNVTCLGNFKIPKKDKAKVNKMLEKTASQYNGKITYY